LDAIFRHFYGTFKNIFEDCGTEFQREIFSSATFRYYSKESEDDDDDAED